MTRRSRRSLPAVCVSLLLLGVCVLVAVCAIQLALGETPLVSYSAVAGTLHETSWAAREVLIFGAVVAAVGLLLVLVSVVPGRARTAPLDERTSISRRGLRNAVRAAARVDGVESASVRVARSRVKASVRTRRTNTDGMADVVRESVQQRLSEIALARTPRVVVRVKASRGAS
ncbi:hypothetical protein BBK82_26415 [Lentzea guizhouensis]|uniref:DUF6286 domain-containing protein n=1 Tax=Lentzea guizhouensis TaxID=1586287 RepID=A0A1B2HMY4_9PSEU|nr:DUF6286 domain-containing protein [Lentzea guizhouensis]ANZ39083.1 hypothetical protein BBK82_26415 [Lentzea guizhouensis]